MTWLLDGNVLVAMSLPDHVYFDRTHDWLAALDPHDAVATCPLTEGTLLRLHLQHARDKSVFAAWNALRNLRAHLRHVFWPDHFSYSEIDPARLTGHRQITDSWLVELARRKGGKLATLDLALSVLWPESAVLIPV